MRNHSFRACLLPPSQFLNVTCHRLRGVSGMQLQFDFDCSQKKLLSYSKWVRAVMRAVAPTPLVITTLPAWLDERDFPPLVRQASRCVLQVHSIRSPKGDAAQMICDPTLARKWVAQAEKIGVPFEIALPTYRYQAGYDADGKFLGVESDSVHAAWPAGTRVREFATDANAMSALIAEWNAHRPQDCAGVLWYLLPVDSDRNNWPMSSLRAVMEGRAPKNSCAVRVNGAPPGEEAVQLADLSIINEGETDDPPCGRIVIGWRGEKVHRVAEALPGWKVCLLEKTVIFVPNDSGQRLPPGGDRAIGWLRLDPAATIHVEILR